MGHHSKDDRAPINPHNLLRLLRYALPYWKCLTVGILAGLLVGGSLFVSISMIPRLVGVIDPENSASEKKSEKSPAAEIVEAVNRKGVSEKFSRRLRRTFKRKGFLKTVKKHRRNKTVHSSGR